jgi:NAD-dependent deacetylase
MTLKEQALECAKMILSSKSTAVLSGAGLSTAAGIPDFRGPHGIYRRADVDADRLFDIGYFHENPSYYYRFHRECVKMLAGIDPTYTHKFLASLEAQGLLDGIVTQNFDGLHEAAGSKKVYTIHGTIRHAHCTHCGEYYGYDAVNKLLEGSDVPHCTKCGGVIKPDIVFFGENVQYLAECERLCSHAELMFVLGSSLNVMPAAFLPRMCPGRIIVVNRGEVAEENLPMNRVALRVDADLDMFFREVAAAMDKD